MSELTNCLQGLIAHYHMTGPHELIVCDAADRIRELEARNEYLLSELRAVGELPRHKMDVEVDRYGNVELFPVVDQANGGWIRAESVEALLK